MLKSVNSKAFSSVCVILSGILWGIIAIFVDGLKTVGFSSVQCAAIRCIFTSLLLLIIVLITDVKSLKVQLKDLLVFLGAGVFGISVFSLCYFKAIHILGGASVPSLLLNTSPIFVLIIASIFFKEKITLNKIVAIVMAVFGVACVSGVFNGVGAISLEGLIFGILSGLGYALYSVFTKSVAKKYNPLVINFYAYLFAMLVVVPASGIFKDIGLLITPKGTLYSLGLVVLCTAVPSVLYSFGMKNLNVSTVSVMAMIDPVTATVIGLAIMSESISVFKIVGIICVLTAIVILNLPQKEKNK